jgi:hypothetical protein
MVAMLTVVLVAASWVPAVKAARVLAGMVR